MSSECETGGYSAISYFESLLWIFARSESFLADRRAWEVEATLFGEFPLGASDAYNYIRHLCERHYLASDRRPEQGIESLASALLEGQVIASGRPGHNAVREIIPALHWVDLRFQTWGPIPDERGVHAVLLQSDPHAAPVIVYHDVLFDRPSLLRRYPPYPLDSRPRAPSTELVRKPSLKEFATSPEFVDKVVSRLLARGAALREANIGRELVTLHVDLGWGEANLGSILATRRTFLRDQKASQIFKKQKVRRRMR